MYRGVGSILEINGDSLHCPERSETGVLSLLNVVLSGR